MTKEFSFSGRSGGSVSLTLASISVCIASMGARVTLMPTVVKEPEPFAWRYNIYTKAGFTTNKTRDIQTDIHWYCLSSCIKLATDKMFKCLMFSAENPVNHLNRIYES